MRILAISVACAASILAAQPVFAAPVSRIVAVVNGDMITSRELDKKLAVELALQGVDPKKSPALAETVRKGLLENMVNEKIILQQAEKEGITVSDADIDAAVAEAIAESKLTREVFLDQLKKEGGSEKLYREQTRSQLLSQRLMGRNVVSKVVVTEDEINDYFRKNMAGFASGRARVAMLVYPVGTDAAKWAEDIASGKVSFADAARKVSIGPNAGEGGDLGFMELSDMAQGMVDVVSRLRPGEVSPLLNLGPNKGQIALLEFEEAEVGDASTMTPDPETAKQIEQILRGPRVQERFRAYTAELRAKALVDIRN